jgi:hypothetical protein
LRHEGGRIDRRRPCLATTPAAHRATKGMRYPADPPTVEEIVAVMRHASDDRHGCRVRALLVVLWRAGLRIQEALVLAEHPLDHRRASILVRNGKGGHRREIGMDKLDWEQLRSNGRIWQYMGTPMTGWQELDNNPATVQIAAARGRPYQRHSTGAIFAGDEPPVPIVH